MTHQVQFPELGISVEVNPVALQFGDFKIYWYGIIIGIGFLLAVLYGFASCKKMNINKDHLFDAIIGGLIGGFCASYVVGLYRERPTWKRVLACIGLVVLAAALFLIGYVRAMRFLLTGPI